MYLRCGGIYITITLVQIVNGVCQWKNSENRSIIGEDMDKSKVTRFHGPPCMGAVYKRLTSLHFHGPRCTCTFYYDNPEHLPTAKKQPSPSCLFFTTKTFSYISTVGTYDTVHIVNIDHNLQTKWKLEKNCCLLPKYVIRYELSIVIKPVSTLLLAPKWLLVVQEKPSNV